MTADLDPIVAGALDRLVGDVDADPDVVLRRTRVAADGLRTRGAARIRRTAVLAIAAFALLAGAAFAASRFDVFPWLDRSNRSSATFSIDLSRAYRGAAPEILVCPSAGAGSFTCSEGTFATSSRRAYTRAERVEAQPELTRSSLERGLATSERKGSVDPATAQRLRRELDAVDDRFFSALQLMSGIETTSGAGGEVQADPASSLCPRTAFRCGSPARRAAIQRS